VITAGLQAQVAKVAELEAQVEALAAQVKQALGEPRRGHVRVDVSN
jgi:outer membrane murein-binding lipoprotein Lpp